MSNVVFLFFDILDELGFSVEYHDLEHLGIDGDCHQGKKLVRLQSGMTRRLHTWKLGHETAHAVFGDVPSMFGPANAKMERRADEWAALRLIRLDNFRESEAIRGGHVASIAHDLDVISDTVEVYQRMLTRIGDTVYMNARLGHGNWAAKFEVA